MDYVNAIDGDDNGNTPLHAACEAGDLDYVRELMADGANVEALNFDAETPLHAACRAGHANICRMLIQECGAQVCAKDTAGSTPLHFACENGHLNIVTCLMEHQTQQQQQESTSSNRNAQQDLMKNTNNGGETPLDCARARSHYSVVQYLGQCGTSARNQN